MRNPVWIYSVRHTGTWFLNGLLSSCDLRTVTYPDIWVSELTGIQFIEQLPAGESLDQKWVDDFFKLYVPAYRVEGAEMLILQGHHIIPEAPIYQALSSAVPSLKVVVPMRDPLLALNSRVWRVAGTIDNLRREGPEKRAARVDRFFKNFADLLAIPREHIFMFPIDTSRTSEEGFRIEQTKRLFEYCELIITDETLSRARKWLPVNLTKDGKYHERYQRRVPTDDFLFSTLKDAIVQGNLEAVTEVLDVEFERLRSHGQNEALISRLKELGYRDLLWWQ